MLRRGHSEHRDFQRICPSIPCIDKAQLRMPVLAQATVHGADPLSGASGTGAIRSLWESRAQATVLQKRANSIPKAPGGWSQGNDMSITSSRPAVRHVIMKSVELGCTVSPPVRVYLLSIRIMMHCQLPFAHVHNLYSHPVHRPKLMDMRRRYLAYARILAADK